jgi:peptidoglycan/xylan/chitin deacetylase (PgdA/CDA1 family)
MSRFGQFARSIGRLIPAAAVRPLGRPAAVLFHGVEPATKDARLQTNHHETDAFLRIARHLKRNFDVLPADALEDVLARPDRHPRAIFLSSDDGYANTLTVAADILAELRLPWTLFVSTHHVATGARNPVFLARLFAFEAPAGHYRIPQLGPVVLGEDRAAAAHRIEWDLRGMAMGRAQEAVDAMIAAMDPANVNALLDELRSEAFLNWDEVRQLKRRGVEIGAHAHRHWPMNGVQSAEDLREQARRSKALIEAEVGPCRHFAYPFGNKGDISRAAWLSVREAGFKAAFTTLSGTLDAADNKFLLPRYGLEADAPHLTTYISLLRAGNPRVHRFQRALAG